MSAIEEDRSGEGWVFGLSAFLCSFVIAFSH